VDLLRASRGCAPRVLPTGVDDAHRLPAHRLALVERVDALLLDTAYRTTHTLLNLCAVRASARVRTIDLGEAGARATGGSALRVAKCFLLGNVHGVILGRAGRVIHETKGAAVAIAATELRRVARRAIATCPLVAARTDALCRVAVDRHRVGMVAAIAVDRAVAARGFDGSRGALVAVGAGVTHWAHIALRPSPEVAADAFACSVLAVRKRVKGMVAAVRGNIARHSRWERRLRRARVVAGARAFDALVVLLVPLALL